MERAQKLLESEKALKSKGRGSYDWRVGRSTNTTVIRWMDHNVVHLASTFIGNQEGEPLKRQCAKERVYKFITCSKMVHEYNQFIGGVDLCDMFLLLYEIRLQSNKWNMFIFYYLIKVAVTNEWLLYRRQHLLMKDTTKALSLLQFQA